MKIKFSIQKKIFLVILVSAVMLIFVIYLDYRNLSALGKSADLILSKNYKSIKDAQQILQKLDVNLKTLLSIVFEEKSTYKFSSNQNQEIAQLIESCKKNITEPGEKVIVDKLYEDFVIYKNKLKYFIENSKNKNLEKYIIPFISINDIIVSNLNELIQINEKAMEVAEHKTELLAKRAIHYSIGLLAASIIFTIVLSMILSKQISQPLTRLAEILGSIKEGSGNYPKITIATNDEIGFLSSEFNRLFERLKEYDHISTDKLLAEKMKVHQAEIAKSKFIADLSHQLKTPMTSLSMSVGIIEERLEKLSSDKRDKLLKTLKEDCIRMSILINELVDIAKLESMVQTRSKEVLNIKNVIQETIKPLISQAEEKGIVLNIEIEKGLPSVAIDSLRFPWVITNLIGNALRYTKQGESITFKVFKKEQRCYFRCSDTGSGIETKYMERIFDRYTQFSERKKSGTIGLGLAIVKEIIEQHGGDISVESDVGKGTTFNFWIPLYSLEENANEDSIDYR